MREELQALAKLPGTVRCSLLVGSGDLTVDDLARALRPTSDDTRILTTSEASDRYGMTPEWWSRRAPDVPGAWQDADASPWYLPVQGCKAYLASRSRKRNKGRRGLRGPNRKADSPPARARAATDTSRSVVGGGSQAVESTEGGAGSQADAA